MPALGTHVMQAKRCFDELEPKVQIDKDFVGASAISHDTVGLIPGGCTRVFIDAHEKKTDEYFLTLIQYIKENGQRENPNAMAFLYGQIMHYALDTSTHPLIYYMTECHPAKFLGKAVAAHALFETWYDVRGEEIEKQKAGEAFNPKYCFVKKVCEGGIDLMIDTVYEAVYGEKDIAKGYKTGIKLWEIFQIRLRRMILNSVKGYFSDFEGMLNADGSYFLHPVTNVRLNTTFEQAYERSVPLACELVALADGSIYGGAANEDTLRAGFGNSYDTGVDWRLPDPKRYFLGYAKK